MFGLGIAPKEIFFAYLSQFVFLTIRLIPGNEFMVDMCGKIPIMGEWIYGITWKHVHFNISVLFIVDTTSSLKLVFPIPYFLSWWSLGWLCCCHYCCSCCYCCFYLFIYLLIYFIYLLFLYLFTIYLFIYLFFFIFFTFYLYIYLFFLLLWPLFLNLLSLLSSLLLLLLLVSSLPFVYVWWLFLLI